MMMMVTMDGPRRQGEINRGAGRGLAGVPCVPLRMTMTPSGHYQPDPSSSLRTTISGSTDTSGGAAGACPGDAAFPLTRRTPAVTRGGKGARRLVRGS